MNEVKYRRLKWSSIIFAWFLWIIAIFYHNWTSIILLIVSFIPYLILNQIKRDGA